MQGDLTTLPRVMAWLGIQGSGQAGTQTLLERLITASSRFVLGYVARATFAPMTVTDNYDGTGKNFLVVRQWPILAVASIQFCGTTIDQLAAGNPPAGPGYLVEPIDSSGGAQQRLTLFGATFPRGRSLIFLTYTFGYQINGEAWTVPATPYEITPLNMWLSDEGVTYANGTKLVAVAGPPGPGQYSVAAGLYTFNSADAAAKVLISYGYVPFDVEQAVIELIGEAYRRKDRIGEVSKSLGGQETVSFSQKDMHDAVRLALQPYCRTAPV